MTLLELLSKLTDLELESLSLTIQEYLSATKKFGSFHSAHEGYAVLKEEVDELWEIVKQKQGNRDPEAMKKEATQVAAMGFRFLVDIALNKDKRFVQS